MQLVDAGEDGEARDALRRWATAYARLHGARLPSCRATRGDRRPERRGGQSGRRAARRRSPTATSHRSSSCSPRSASSGRCGASMPASSSSPRAWPTRCATGSRRRDQEDVTRAAMSDLDEQLDDRGRGADRPDPSDAAAAGPRVRRRSSPCRVDQGDDGLRPGRPRQLPTSARGARPRPRPGHGAARVPVVEPRPGERRRSGRRDRGRPARPRAGRPTTTGRGNRRFFAPSSRSSRCTLVDRAGRQRSRPCRAAGDAPARRHRRRGAAALTARRCARSPMAGSTMLRESSTRSTGSTTANRYSAGSRSGGSAARSWRWPAATKLRVCGSTASAAAEMRELQLPGIPRTGLEPWALFGDAMALTAHAYFAPDDDLARGRALFAHCREHALRVSIPATCAWTIRSSGMVLFALGAWGLLRRELPGRGRHTAARARRPVRLQPHDPDDGVGADRPARRGSGPRPASRRPWPSTATTARRTC